MWNHVTSRNEAEADDMCEHQRASLWYNKEKHKQEPVDTA